MRILLIGKNGYISTCFQRYIKKYKEIQVDVISARNAAWEEVSFFGYDGVFNATGLAHNDARRGTEEQFMALNVDLPIKLATKAYNSHVPIFVNMSSMIVYGEKSPISIKKAITMDTIPMPNNIYGRSKLLGENGLLRLSNNDFCVAIIRSSLVYSEDAIDNFLKLREYATRFPVFPNIENYRSMIYADNLCELIKLIIENKKGGIFYPQQEKYICISELVKDIADETGHKIWLTKSLNPLFEPISKYFGFIRKVFGNEFYEMSMSNHFDGAYRVVDYKESIRRLVAMKRGN